MGLWSGGRPDWAAAPTSRRSRSPSPGWADPAPTMAPTCRRCARPPPRAPELLDTQAGDRPADHELLDLARAFEDRVVHVKPFTWCWTVPRSPSNMAVRLEWREEPD